MNSELDPEQLAWLKAQRDKHEAELDEQLLVQAERYNEEHLDEPEYPEIPEGSANRFIVLTLGVLAIGYFFNLLGWAFILIVGSLFILSRPEVRRFWATSSKSWLTKSGLICISYLAKLALLGMVVHSLTMLSYHPINQYKGTQLIPPGSHAFYQNHGLQFTKEYAIRENPTDFLIALGITVLFFVLSRRMDMVLRASAQDAETQKA